MTKKPTYEELAAKANELEHEKASLLLDLKRHRALIEDANEIIAITDEQGIISIVNKKVEEVSCYSRDELIGESVLKIAHPEDKDQYVRFWKDTLEGRRPS